MKYSDIRSSIKSGDLVAWSHKGLKSWYDIKVQIVRMFTRSEYSHVGICWVIGDRVLVLEAVQPLVRIYPMSNQDNFFHVSMNVPWDEEIESFALSKVGEKYSQLEAVSSFVNKSFKNKTWQCAEYVWEIYNKANIVLSSDLTPSHIVQQALTRGSILRYVEIH